MSELTYRSRENLKNLMDLSKSDVPPSQKALDQHYYIERLYCNSLEGAVRQDLIADGLHNDAERLFNRGVAAAMYQGFTAQQVIVCMTDSVISKNLLMDVVEHPKSLRENAISLIGFIGQVFDKTCLERPSRFRAWLENVNTAIGPRGIRQKRMLNNVPLIEQDVATGKVGQLDMPAF